MVGTYVLSAGFYDAYYNRARKVRALIKKDFDDAFTAGIDAILTPATPSAAFGLGEMNDEDPVKMYLNDVFTVTVNLAGLPGISVPTGVDHQGLPLGLQLIGRPWEEGDLLNTAYALEAAAGFVAKPGNGGKTAQNKIEQVLVMRAILTGCAVLALAACSTGHPRQCGGCWVDNANLSPRRPKQ